MFSCKNVFGIFIATVAFTTTPLCAISSPATTAVPLSSKTQNADEMLLAAFEYNDPQSVKNALAAGANVHKKMERGRTILMMVCHSSGFKQELVPAGMPGCLHCCDVEHAPWRAAWEKLLEDRRTIISILLQAGARVDDCDDEGQSVLHLACICNTDWRKVQLIIDAGANANARNADGKTPLDEAMMDDCGTTVKILKAAGATCSSIS